MILSSTVVGLILQAAELGHTLEIEGVILDDEGMRGYNEDEGVIIRSIGDHDFGIDPLGISRLSSLRQKSSLLKKSDGFTVEAIEHKNKPGVTEKLLFECGKISFEFRCATVKSIKDMPKKKLNTKPLFNFDITEEDVDAMQQGAKAMRSKYMTIQNKDGVLMYRFSDETGDILNFKVDSEVTSHEDGELVSLTINIKKMFPIFKLAVQGGTFRLNILTNDIMHLYVGDIEVLVMPEVT